MSKELYIEVENELDVNRGTSSKTGKPYEIVNQIGHLFNDQKYPTRCKIRLKSESDKMEAGIYLINLNQALWVDKYQGIQISITPDNLIRKK